MYLSEMYIYINRKPTGPITQPTKSSNKQQCTTNPKPKLRYQSKLTPGKPGNCKN